MVWSSFGPELETEEGKNPKGDTRAPGSIIILSVVELLSGVVVDLGWLCWTLTSRGQLHPVDFECLGAGLEVPGVTEPLYIAHRSHLDKGSS